jgi:malic enzyme
MRMSFSGLSVGNVVTPDMVKSMAKNPIVFAMANPDPEISYEDATMPARILSWPQAGLIIPTR